jgi:hypothetical protein
VRYSRSAHPEGSTGGGKFVAEITADEIVYLTSICSCFCIFHHFSASRLFLCACPIMPCRRTCGVWLRAPGLWQLQGAQEYEMRLPSIQGWAFHGHWVHLVHAFWCWRQLSFSFHYLKDYLWVTCEMKTGSHTATMHLNSNCTLATISLCNLCIDMHTYIPFHSIPFHYIPLHIISITYYFHYITY